MARVNGITQSLPATHTTIQTLPCKHSPDGTTRTRRHTSYITFYLIYRPRKDERLRWPSWLTHSGRLTHISGHPSAAGRAWDMEVRWSKTNVLTTVPRNQPAHWTDSTTVYLFISPSTNNVLSVLNVVLYDMCVRVTLEYCG